MLTQIYARHRQLAGRQGRCQFARQGTDELQVCPLTVHSCLISLHNV